MAEVKPKESTPFRILWVCGSNIVGGAERVPIQIIRLLRDRGHVIGAIFPRNSAIWRETEDLEPRYPARFGGSADFYAIVTLARAIRAFHPDVLLVTTPNEWIWSCILPRELTRARLVLVRHMALRLAPGVRWIADLRADAVVAVSETVKANLLGRVGIQPDLIRVIPNPVRFPVLNEVPSQEDRNHHRTRLGLERSARWIGFFGGVDRRKGIADIMKATELIRSNGLDVRLLLCGRTNDPGKSVAELASQYGLEGLVHNAGEVIDVASAMMAVDAIAIATNSSLGEGLPLVALEAMACGTPIAGYAIDGVAEALGREQDCGLLARRDDPEDLARCLGRMLNDNEFAHAMAVRGLNRARSRFDPNLAADRYEDLFRTIVAARTL